MEKSVGEQELLAPLQEFTRAVWGKDTIFKKKLQYHLRGIERSAEYLDLGDHYRALQALLPGWWNSKFLVRKEYHFAMEIFEEGGQYPLGAYVVGQPGIGKTYFLAYALIERLRKKHPVAFELDQNRYALFTGADVTIHSSHSRTPLEKSDLWALSDSNQFSIIPAWAFQMTPGVRVFQATSPNSSRWKEWSKQHGAEPYIMDVWSTEETADLASLLDFDVERMTALATAWGGVPRPLLRLFRSLTSESAFENKIKRAAFKAVTSPNCISSFQELNIESSGPSSIFTIKPRQDSDGRIYRNEAAIYVATPTTLDLLAVNLRQRDARIKSDFFTAMGSCSTTRSSAGIIYERWFHSHFVSGQSTHCQWHDGNLPPTLPPVTRFISTIDELKHATPPFHWIAPTTNFPGIDSALITEDNIFAIQVTLAYSLRTPQTGLNKLRSLLPPAMRDLRWSVLFVGHSDDQVYKVSEEWVGKLIIDMPSGRGPVPVGWCSLDPTARNITYIGSDGTRYDPEKTAQIF
ncbi:hypothetical protein BS17DRAFT_215610 [Gyrodon lividus]|nr:hypothetical protein BS17DRAFT_215610 [Gyrodon lividus]